MSALQRIAPSESAQPQLPIPRPVICAYLVGRKTKNVQFGQENACSLYLLPFPRANSQDIGCGLGKGRCMTIHGALSAGVCRISIALCALPTRQGPRIVDTQSVFLSGTDGPSYRTEMDLPVLDDTHLYLYALMPLNPRFDRFAMLGVHHKLSVSLYWDHGHCMDVTTKSFWFTRMDHKFESSNPIVELKEKYMARQLHQVWDLTTGQFVVTTYPSGPCAPLPPNNYQEYVVDEEPSHPGNLKALAATEGMHHDGGDDVSGDDGLPDFQFDLDDLEILTGEDESFISALLDDLNQE